jgi:hypothetical protein
MRVPDKTWVDLFNAEFLIDQACSIREPLGPAGAEHFTKWTDEIHEAVVSLGRIALPDAREFPRFAIEAGNTEP